MQEFAMNFTAKEKSGQCMQKQCESLLLKGRINRVRRPRDVKATTHPAEPIQHIKP